MAKANEQSKALLLRQGGQSIGEIARVLKVSKSTVSGWCKDITLSDKQIRNIAEKSKHQATMSLLRASEIQRKKRQNDVIQANALGKQDVGLLTKRDLHMVGLGLYWGEGYKKGSQELGFTNSDPAMIQFYIKWLSKIYGIKKEDLILRISINSQHSRRISELIHHWSTVTGVPSVQFTKTSLIKSTSKKIYKNPEEHFGTLRIKVRRGTDLRRRILGSISALVLK